MEKNGIAYCASDFSKTAQKERIVYAKPVFPEANTAQEQLPLADLYDHPDFIDVISAREFGLESLPDRRFLLCILVAQTPEALDDMEEMILGERRRKTPVLSARCDEGRLILREKTCEWSVPYAESAVDTLRKEKASVAAIFAAVTQWCVGYPLQFYMPEEMA